MSYVKSEFNRALVNRFHLELLDKGDLSLADEVVDPEFVAHVPGAPTDWLHGIEGVKRAVVALRSAFTDFSVKDREDTITKGGRVANRWVLTATHTSEFLGIPATGTQITITGISICRVEPAGPGGKIAELWVQWDQLGLMQQLDAVRQREAATV